MRRLFAAGAALAAILALAPDAGAVQPYVMFEAGVMSRDVVEENDSIVGYQFGGTASSTRVLATVGLDFNNVVTVYAQGGAADLGIDEFNGFDSSFEGTYGGGVRLNLLLSQNPYGLRLFVDGSTLRTTATDTVQAQVGSAWRTVEEEIEWNEYTILMGAGSRYGPYGPYGGIRLSWLDATDRLRAAPAPGLPAGFKLDADLKEQDNFGMFFGTDIFLDRSGKTSLNFEVALIDQYSFRAAIRRAF
jgi:opacity protein-like surface antigen